MKKFVYSLIVLAFCTFLANAQTQIPCKVIREIHYPVTQTEPYKQPLKFALINVCPDYSGMEQRPMMSFYVNGEIMMREYVVEKVFANKAEADEYAKQNNIVEPNQSMPKIENVADCQIIRVIGFPLGKRDPKEKVTKKLALLNTCLNDKEIMQRPSILVTRNGKKESRLFDVMKTFANKTEAKTYAKENGITDVKYK
jgi:hypothetical protein